MELKQKRDQIKQITSEGQQLINNGKLNEAVDLFKKAYAYAQKSQDHSIELTCALNLSAAYIEAGKQFEALDVLDKAKPLYKERYQAYNGDVYYNYAEAYRALEKYNMAVKYYLDAFDEFRSNPDAQIDCLEKCIQVYIIRNEYSKVVDAYERMIAVYKVQGNLAKQASCLCELATKHKQFRDTEAALKTVSEAAQILQKVEVDADEEDPVVTGTVFNDLGLVYSQLLQYDHACVWFERALQTTSKSKYHEAVVLQNMGAAYKFQGQYHVAVDCFEKAAEIYANLKNRVSQGQCFYNMAFAYIELGCAEEADVAFNHALQAAKDCGDTTTKWQALEGLGDNKFTQGNYEKAQEFYFDALAVIPITKKDVRERVQIKVQGVIKEMTVRGGSFREPRLSQRGTGSKPFLSLRSTYQPSQRVSANKSFTSLKSTFPPSQRWSADKSRIYSRSAHPPSDTVALHSQYAKAVKEKEEQEEDEDQTLGADDSNSRDFRDFRNKQEEFEDQKTETEKNKASIDEEDRTSARSDFGQGPSTSKTSGETKKKKKTSLAHNPLGKKGPKSSRKTSRRLKEMET